MAIYDRTQGQLPTTSQTMPALPSMDISSIIVRSLQTALEGADSEDKELSDQIADGINKSDLIKAQKGGVSKGESKSPIDDLLSGGEKNRTKAYEKHLKKQEDLEKKARAERAARDRAVEKAFDTTLRGLSTFAQNPLKGLDNALQAGFKGLFKFGNNLLHKTTTDLKNDMKKMGATVTAPIRAVGKVGMGAITGAMAVGKVIGGGVAKLAGKGGGLEKPAPLDTDALLKKDGTKETKVAKVENKNAAAAKTEGQTKGEKDAKEAKEGKVEKKRDKQAGDQLAAVQSTNLTVGMIFGKIAAFAVGFAAIALLFPIIVGKISDLIITIKRGFKEAPASFSVTMLKVKTALMGGLYDLLSKVKVPKILGGGSLFNPGLTDEEKKEMKTLEKDRAVQEYMGTMQRLNDMENYGEVTQELKQKAARGEFLSESEQEIWNEYQSNLAAVEKLKSNENVLRYEELASHEGRTVEDVKKELVENKDAEIAKIWDEHYSDLSKLTAREAADIMNAGTEKYGDALIGRLAEYVNKGGTFQAETDWERRSRLGGKVGAEMQNVVGELGHNLVVSTKEGTYQRHENYDPNAELRRAVNNYQTNNTTVTVTTSGDMRKGT